MSLKRISLEGSGLATELSNEIHDNMDDSDVKEEEDETPQEKINESEEAIGINEGPAGPYFFSVGNEGSSIIQAIAITFGTGVLSMPSAIHKVGFLPALIIFVLCSAAQQYTMNLLLSGALNLKNFDYYDLTFKTKGKIWANAYGVLASTFLMFTIMNYNDSLIDYVKNIYFISSRDNTLFRTVCHVTGITTEKKYNYAFQVVTLIIFTVIEIIMIFIKHPHKVHYLSCATVALITLTGLIVFFEAPFLYFRHTKDVFELFNTNKKIDSKSKFVDHLFSYSNCIMMFLFAYFNHFGVLNILSKQRDKTDIACKRVMKNSFIFEAIFYLLVGFFGFLGLSADCADYDFSYINRDDGWGKHQNREDYALVLCRIFYIFALLSIISIRIDLIEDIIKHFFSDQIFFEKIEFIWKICVLFFLSLLSFTVNFVTTKVGKNINIMNNLIEIFNSIVGIGMSFYIPLFIFHSIYGRKRKRSKFGYVCFIFFTFVSLCVIISTIWFSFRN